MLTLTLWTAVGMALGAEGSTNVALSARAGTDYSGGDATFRPVSLSLVDDLLGRNGGSGTDAHGISPGGDDARDLRGGGGNGPGGDDPNGAPDLFVWIEASDYEVEPDQEVTYTVFARNIGDAPANGVRVQTHVPEHMHVAEGACGGQFANQNCLDPFSPINNPGPVGHVERGLDLILNPGDVGSKDFKFVVNLTAPNNVEIPNHGHAYNSVVSSVTSATVTVKIDNEPG